VDDAGRFKGQLKPTGIRPRFAEKLADYGIKLKADLFAAPGGPAPTVRGRRPVGTR
jgi:pilus assembly protein CpaF